MRHTPDNDATKQIQEFAAGMPEDAWLCSVGLLDSETEDYGVDLNEQWYRGGGESYILDFTVNSSQQHRLVAKACIKSCASQAMNEWLERRQILQSSGVATPRLFAARRATLLEEFIPYHLKDAWERADAATQRNFGMLAVQTYSTMLRSGFNPIGLHDMRSRGNDIVAIDFGSDLGGSSAHGRQASGNQLKTGVNRLMGFTIAGEL